MKPHHHRDHRFGPGGNHHHLNFNPISELIEKLLIHLRRFFNSDTDYQWIIREATKEGPPHKQVRNSILLGQLAQIIEQVNANGESIEKILVSGTSPRECGFQYPVGVPKEVFDRIEGINHDEALTWIGEGPFHEVAMDLTLMIGLAAIKNAIDNSNKTVRHDSHEKNH